MPFESHIRLATPQDAAVVADILQGAARWLEQSRTPLWQLSELEPARIAVKIHFGLYFLAECSGASACTVKFQLEDPVFWPDAQFQDAAYIHRLAVRRRFAGTGVSAALLRWAAERPRTMGRQYLRLDCDAKRPRLRAVYERFGFRYNSDMQVGPYLVARYELDVTNLLT